MIMPEDCRHLHLRLLGPVLQAGFLFAANDPAWVEIEQT
jgi:hypothetical protein